MFGRDAKGRFVKKVPDDEDDGDDSNATPEQEPQSMIEANVYNSEDSEENADSGADGRDEGKASESHV